MKQHICRRGRPWLVAACLIVACLLPAGAATVRATSGPSYVPDEYIIQAVAGTSLSKVSESVAMLGGTLIKPLSLPDTYLVKMNTKTAAGASGVRTARFASSSPWVIKRFQANLLARFDATPEDPYWDKLWGLKSINMPMAWNVQKGSSSVTAAVLDTGVGNHPDLDKRVLWLLGKDYVDGDNDPSNDTYGHGTHVSGTIAAQGDNQIGVCGVCWDNVQILPIRIGDASGVPLSNAIDGLSYAANNGADVVNMSFGWPYNTQIPELQAAIETAASQGLILCASAGNSNNDPDESPYVGPPACYPECIAVGAIGPTDAIAYYSSYGPGKVVDIAAPGGDQSQGYDAGIYSTAIEWVSGKPVFTYEAMQGTSMACPHVVGAAALLLSAGIPSSQVRTRLESSARRPAVGAMDPEKYGAGILDVSAALANGAVTIMKPAKGATVNSAPDFKFNVRGIDEASVAIYLDYADKNGDGEPDDLSVETPFIAGSAVTNYLIGAEDKADKAIVFNWNQVKPGEPLAPGFHFLYICADTTFGNEKVSDWGTFTVASKIIPAGQHLVSFPYDFTTNQLDGTFTVDSLPSDLLLDASTSQPLDFRSQLADRPRLIRWSAPQSSYYSYITGLDDPSDNTPRFDDKSWLNPVARMLLPSGAVQPVPTAGGYLPNDVIGGLQFPAGTGFWLVLQKDAVVNSNVQQIDASQGFNIPLYKGWNLIGNPYTRDVPLTAVRLTYQGATRTLDEDQLARRPWVDRYIYGYKSGYGYQLVPANKRLFEPYKGYWLRANVGGIAPQESLIVTLQ